MANSNIKLFDENKANIMTDEEYLSHTQRINGVQTGIASSMLTNKSQYQASLVAYAIAQLMLANGLNAMDSDAVSTFVANLSGSLLQKVADMASSAEAAAGIITNKYISPATMKAAALLLSGGTMTGPINMASHQITNIPDPVGLYDAANVHYAQQMRDEAKTYADNEFVYPNNKFTLIGTITDNQTHIFYIPALTREIFFDYYFEGIVHASSGYIAIKIDWQTMSVYLMNSSSSNTSSSLRGNKTLQVLTVGDGSITRYALYNKYANLSDNTIKETGHILQTENTLQCFAQIAENGIGKYWINIYAR